MNIRTLWTFFLSMVLTLTLLPTIAIAATPDSQYFDQASQTFQQSEQQYTAGVEQAKQTFNQAQDHYKQGLDQLNQGLKQAQEQYDQTMKQLYEGFEQAKNSFKQEIQKFSKS